MTYKPHVAELLVIMRQHPGFPELIADMEAPQLPRFRKSQGTDAAAAHALWTYESGRLQQHENWIAYLTGKGEPK